MRLPVTLQLPPPQALTQVRKVAAVSGDFFVEMNLELLEDRRPRQVAKGVSKGIFTGDFSVMRRPDQGLVGAGLLATESWARTMDALRAALSRKTPKLAGYKATVAPVWLFLIADGLIANWEDILARDDLVDLKNEIERECANAGFQRVLLWRERQKVTVLY